VRLFGLAVILSSAAASAEPVFTSAPLAGALEYAVNRTMNQAKLAEIRSFSTLRTIESNQPGTRTYEPGKLGVGPSPADKGLTPNDIDAVMKASAKSLRTCYQQELARSPELAGRIVVKFLISPAGSVTSASIVSTTMKSPRVESCIVSTIKQLTFPAKAVGTASVTYPFIFSRG
jgi:TonB family protein